MNTADDTILASKITTAIKAVDEAIADQVEKAKAAGLLLHEAHKLHPGRTAFEKFLKLTDGVHYSRAMDLIAVATDRKTLEKLKADNASKNQKLRDKKKAALPKPLPKQPEPKPKPVLKDPPPADPVRHVTDDNALGDAIIFSTFEEGVMLLRQVMRTPAVKFKATFLSADDLTMVADFLKQVAEKKSGHTEKREAA